MPWNDVTVKEQRQNFIRDYRLGYCTISDLAASFGISRKTAYKWIDRWEQHGAEGLRDLSRRPSSSPWQTPEAIREELLAVRGSKPHWGPKKVLDIVSRKHPRGDLPPRKTKRFAPHPNPYQESLCAQKPAIPPAKATYIAHSPQIG